MQPDAIRFEAVETDEQTQKTAQLADVIWHECYAKILKPEQIDYMVGKMQSATAMAAQMQNEGYEYYLVYYGNEAVGYVGIQAKDGMLLLSKLYVLAEYRGKGIAQAAMGFVEQRGRAQDCEGVWLTVNRHNQRAIAAYRKTGYTQTRTQQSDIGGGFIMDDFIFEKPL